MISYPEPDEVLDGLGDKVVERLSKSVRLAADDLREYRTCHPSWVADHCERGLANWIHDRVWAHVVAQFDGHSGVTVGSGEPTREIVVGVNYRLRVKRHREEGQLSSYPTQTALEFYTQGVQPAFPGLEEVRLAAGYEWNDESREIGDAVLSLRDSMDNLIWQISLPAPPGGTSRTRPIRPNTPEPLLPSIEVQAAESDAPEADAR